MLLLKGLFPADGTPQGQELGEGGEPRASPHSGLNSKVMASTLRSTPALFGHRRVQ